MKKLTDKLVPALALIFAAAITICVLTAATPPNIPISGMNITTQAVEGAYFPLIQPWPGRATNDNWRIAKSNLFAGVSVSYVTNLTVYSNLYVNTNIVINTNITINSNVVMTFADTLWTNDAAGLRPADHVVYNQIVVSNMHTYGWEGRDPEYVLVTTGSNTLDTTAFSSLLIFSEETNAASAIISLSPGLFNGQELELYNYTNSFWAGQFTLPANSQVLPFGGGYVKLRNNMDWATTNGSGLTLRYIAPDWIEMDRSYFGYTNAPTDVVMNPTDNRVPYRIDADEFGDSALIHVSSTEIGIGAADAKLSSLGDSLVFEGNSTTPRFYIKNTSGKMPHLDTTAGGGILVEAENGQVVDLRDDSGVGVRYSSTFFAPISDATVSLGNTDGNRWLDAAISGSHYVFGFRDAVTNYSRLGVTHTGTNGAIVFDSQSANSAGVARDFTFASNSVEIARIGSSGLLSLNSLPFFNGSGSFQANVNSQTAYITNITVAALTTGDNTIFTAPTGYKAIPMSGYFSKTNTGTTFYSVKYRTNGVNYLTGGTPATSGTSTRGQVGLVDNLMRYDDDSFVFGVNQDEGPAVVSFLVVTNTIPINTYGLLSLSSGDNTLYTVPTNTIATVYIGTQGMSLRYGNASGGSRNIQWYYVPVGQTTTTFPFLVATNTVSDGNSQSVGLMGATYPPFMMKEGDSIVINTDANTATQSAFVTVLELPE